MRSLVRLETQVLRMSKDIEDVKDILTATNPAGYTLEMRLVLVEHHQADQNRRNRDLTMAVYTAIGLLIANAVGYILQFVHFAPK
jgi:hypothetical protein